MLRCQRRFFHICKATRKYNKWGIFGDVHFQDEGLQHVVQTGNWMVQTFAEQQVSQVICLGDVLNTRETVTVQSLSAALAFFEKLAQVPSINKIHIILGYIIKFKIIFF